MNLVGKVEHRINETKLIQPHDKIVVAVSGGPDSVALLHVLVQLSSIYQWQLLVAHVNHKFRGSESDLEAEFVRELAVSLQLPYEIADIDVPSYIMQSSLNVQTAAREKRYEFLYHLAESHHAQKIAVAHHADDQAETLIMRMIRGTSPAGLVAIPERRTEKKVELIRPFLRIYKTEVEAYCLENQYAFCVDSSNHKKTYFRNQVRLDALPYLQTFNPKISKSLNQLSEIMLHEDEYMNRQTMLAMESLVHWEQRNADFSRNDFLEFPIAIQRRVIKAIVYQTLQENSNLEFEAIERIRGAIVHDRKTTIKLDFHKKIAFVREYDKIGFYANLPSSEQYMYVIDRSTTELVIPEINMKICVSWKISDDQHQNIAYVQQEYFEQIAWFDAKQIIFPLEIRNRKPGDRFQPYGFSGTKKIKDMFIDAKIPPSWREKAPIIADATGKVVWIPCIRRSKHALIHDETTEVIQIQIETNHPNK